jgi:hypothetical protein
MINPLVFQHCRHDSLINTYMITPFSIRSHLCLCVSAIPFAGNFLEPRRVPAIRSHHLKGSYDLFKPEGRF